jgi:hypothetical protein
MVADRAVAAASQARRATAHNLPSCGVQRHCVCRFEWLSVAGVAEMLSTGLDDSQLFRCLRKAGLFASINQLLVMAAREHARRPRRSPRRYSSPFPAEPALATAVFVQNKTFPGNRKRAVLSGRPACVRLYV